MSLVFLGTGSLKSMYLSNVGAVLTLPKECTSLGNRVLFLIKKMSNSVSVTTNQKQIGLLNYGVGNAPLDLIYMWVIEIHQFQTESLYICPDLQLFLLNYLYFWQWYFINLPLRIYSYKHTKNNNRRFNLLWYEIMVGQKTFFSCVQCNFLFYANN